MEERIAESDTTGRVDDGSSTSNFDGLTVLCRAMAGEAGLTEAGRRSADTAVQALLQVRAQVEALYEARPEIGAVPVDRPVFITGLHRSGTTLAHRLLAAHPGLRAPQLWEQVHPADQGDPEALIRATHDYVEEYRRAAPGLPAIHYLDARLSDECHRLISPTFETEIFELRYHVPSYGRWLAGRPRIPGYAYHRRLLRAILWRRPADRVVLKCPFHLGHLGALRTVYPDALVIRLHRDPADTIPSACSLTATIRAARATHVDHRSIVQFWLERTTNVLHTVLDGPDALNRAGGAVLDVRYADLVADPIGTVRRMCAFAEVPFDDPARDAVTSFLAGHHQHRHGRHRYDPATFGLDAGDLAGRFDAYRTAAGL
jgi:hypothetical protein